MRDGTHGKKNENNNPNLPHSLIQKDAATVCALWRRGRSSSAPCGRRRAPPSPRGGVPRGPRRGRPTGAGRAPGCKSTRAPSPRPSPRATRADTPPHSPSLQPSASLVPQDHRPEGLLFLLLLLMQLDLLVVTAQAQGRVEEAEEAGARARGVAGCLVQQQQLQARRLEEVGAGLGARGARGGVCRGGRGAHAASGAVRRCCSRLPRAHRAALSSLKEEVAVRSVCTRQ